jgi:PIN domain nuclease of toxin-antitoxin system
VSSFILDSSALIALVQKEKGADVVAANLKGALMSSVNFSEVVAVLARKLPKAAITLVLKKLVAEVVSFDEEQAIEAGFLYQQTKHLGLSLGDRACLALAKLKGLPILTADQAWSGLELGVQIKNIR